MRKIFSYWLWAVGLCFVIFLHSCKNNGGTPEPCEIEFDQSAMFQNLADNVIIPDYLNLKEMVDDLELKTRAFLLSTDIGHHTQLVSAYFQVYYAWQKVAQYEFGPAGSVFLRSSLNNFPANIDEIRANIISGSYDFNLPDRYDKGLPALDYLITGVGTTSEEVVAVYTTDSLANQHQNYLKNVVNDMKERVDHTYSEWINGGYLESFINNTGTAAGTSLSLIVNGFNENYELIKRDKIGIPSGVLTLGFTNPTKVECYYGGLSVNLASYALKASRDFYLGRSQDGTDGLGLDDYLEAAGVQKGGESLNLIIQNQFEAAIQAVESMEEPLSEYVDTNPTETQAAYAEISKQLVNIKTDLPTALCVAITYVDNPSDSD